jgi:hypothetical protein
MSPVDVRKVDETSMTADPRKSLIWWYGDLRTSCGTVSGSKSRPALWYPVMCW